MPGAPSVQRSLLANYAECDREGELEGREQSLQRNRRRQTVGADLARVELNVGTHGARATEDNSVPVTESSEDTDSTDDGPARQEKRTKLGNDQANPAVLESDSDDDIQPGQERKPREEETSDGSDDGLTAPTMRPATEMAAMISWIPSLCNLGNEIENAPLAPEDNLIDPAVPTPVESAAGDRLSGRASGHVFKGKYDAW